MKNKNRQEIFPLEKLFVSRKDKEKLLKQRAKAIWFTGLSSSGKTSIAVNLEKKLHNEGFLVKVLDGDNMRASINKDLGFTEADRKTNIERIAHINKTFIDCGIIVINCFISPTHEIRQMAKKIIGDEDVIEIYLKCPLDVCEKRDVKGLYAKARQGLLSHFTGIDSPYEIPDNPHLIVDTEKLSVQGAALFVYEFVINRIKNS